MNGVITTMNDYREAEANAVMTIRRSVWMAKHRLHVTNESFVEYCARLELQDLVAR